MIVIADKIQHYQTASALVAVLAQTYDAPRLKKKYKISGSVFEISSTTGGYAVSVDFKALANALKATDGRKGFETYNVSLSQIKTFSNGVVAGFLFAAAKVENQKKDPANHLYSLTEELAFFDRVTSNLRPAPKVFGLFDYSMLPKVNRLLKEHGLKLQQKSNRQKWGDKVEISVSSL